jgi:hypothetical protein
MVRAEENGDDAGFLGVLEDEGGGKAVTLHSQDTYVEVSAT